MRFTHATCVAALLCAAVSATYAASAPSYVDMAVNAPGRIPDDRKMDGDRKPADTATFSMVKPGAKIAVYEPNGELYYTRIFSKIVGPKGKVYVFVPAPGYPAQVRGAEQDMIKKGTMPPPNPVDVANAIMNAKDYANVRVIWEQLYAFGGEFGLPEQLDVIWSARGYNDLHNKGPLGGPPGNKVLDVVAVDKAIFATLKPGGYFVVADAAAKGSGFGMTENLHRADPDSVKTEIQSAGFTFDAESNVLANASDDHAGAAGAQSDQYLLRFRKPTSAPDAKRPSNSVLSAFYGNTIHSGVGTPVQRWDLYHEDGTYQEYGNTGTRAQTASWYWDTASRNCHIHEYPAQELSFTDCHIIEAGPKPGESWTEGEGSAARKYELLKGSVLPPGQ